MSQANAAQQAILDQAKPQPVEPITPAPLSEAFKAGESLAKSQQERDGKEGTTKRDEIIAAYESYGKDDVTREQWLNGYASGFGNASGKIRKSEAATIFRALATEWYQVPGTTADQRLKPIEMIKGWQKGYNALVDQCRLIAPAQTRTATGNKKVPKKAVETMVNTLQAVPASSIENSAVELGKLARAAVLRLPVSDRAEMAKAVFQSLPNDSQAGVKAETLVSEITSESVEEKIAKVDTIIRSVEFDAVYTILRNCANYMKTTKNQKFVDTGASILDVLDVAEMSEAAAMEKTA